MRRCNSDEAPRLKVHLDHCEPVPVGTCGLSMNCWVDDGFQSHTSSIEPSAGITSEMEAWLASTKSATAFQPALSWLVWVIHWAEAGSSSALRPTTKATRSGEARYRRGDRSRIMAGSAAGLTQAGRCGGKGTKAGGPRGAGDRPLGHPWRSGRRGPTIVSRSKPRGAPCGPKWTPAGARDAKFRSLDSTRRR